MNLDASSLNAKCCLSCKKLKICYLFIAILALLFQSCELEPNMPENTVQVQIINYNGLQPISLYYEELNMSIGSFPISVPDANGNCYFKNVNKPYDLNLTLAYQPCTYKGLSLQDPKIVSFHEFASSPNFIHVKVKFPTIKNGRYGRIHFLSSNMFLQDREDLLLSGDSITTCTIDIPENKTSISGKLAFIQYYAPYPTGISDYTNWGVKDVSFMVGSSAEVSFMREDLTFDPAETEANIDISYPNDPDLTVALVYLHFPGYNKNSDMLIEKITDCGKHVNEIVPASLNIPFLINVKSTYIKFPESYLFDLEKFKSIQLQPGSSGSIVNKRIVLLTPSNNQERVSMNSYLSVKEEGEKGIYLFCIGGLIMITPNSSIRIRDVYFRDRSLERNSSYRWEVIKLSSFNSIDEFTSSPYIFQENFSSIEYSEKWWFTTAP